MLASLTVASTYLDLQAITRCEAARSGDDRQARHRLLQRLALARRAIIGMSFPPIPWPMTLGKHDTHKPVYAQLIQHGNDNRQKEMCKRICPELGYRHVDRVDYMLPPFIFLF